MPDIRAGALVWAPWDFPPSVTATDSTSIANISTTTYTAGTPVVSVSFYAPTSGRVLVTVGLGVRNNALDTNRTHASFRIVVNNSSGTEVISADVTRRGAGGVNQCANYQYVSRTVLEEGLTPGQLYYAEYLYKVSGGNTCDINTRDLTVVPVP